MLWMFFSNSDHSIKIQDLAVDLFVSLMSISRQSSKAVHTILLQCESCSDGTSFSLSIQHLLAAVPAWAPPLCSILGSASWRGVVLALRSLVDPIRDDILQKRGTSPDL